MFITKCKKTPYYQLVYLHQGKKTTVSTKTANKRDAEKFLLEFQINASSTSQSELEPSTKKVSLKEFKNEFISYCKNIKSPKYVLLIQKAFKQFELLYGESYINDLTSRDVDMFITKTFSRTPTGAHQYFRTLRAAFNKAVDWNIIAINPFSKIKLPKIPRSLPTFISEHELQLILSQTNEKYLKDIITVGFYTGIRLGELVNMSWDWVDFSTNQITVKCTNEFITKSKKERIIPMSNKVREILISRFQDEQDDSARIVFFRIKKRMLNQESISKKFKKLVRKAELNDKIHFHSIRHSFCSLLVQKGVSLYVVKELVGHEDLKTTQIYSHLRNDDLKTAINVFNY